MELKGVQALDIIDGKTIVGQAKALISQQTQYPKCQAKSFRIKSTHQRHFKHAILEQKFVQIDVKSPILAFQELDRTLRK